MSVGDHYHITLQRQSTGVAVSVTGVRWRHGDGLGSVTYNDSSDVPINAGTYNVVATFNGDSNYNSASGTGTLTINKATPVVSVSGRHYSPTTAIHRAQWLCLWLP